QYGLLLENHGDAGIECAPRRSDPDFLAIDDHVSFIRLINPVQPLEEGGFAGALLGDETGYLALVDGEGHIVERLHARKGFGDAADFENRLHHFTTSRRERSRASATAAIMRRPWTPCCT